MIYYCKECKTYFTDDEAEEVNTTYESELGLDDGHSTPESYLTCPCGSDQIEEICETIDEEELCEQLNDCGIPDLYDYIELREELKMKKKIKDLTEEELKGLEDKAYKFRDEKGLRGLVTKNHIIWFINGTIDIPDKHILDKQEHDYLRAVCKPYKVEYIRKTETQSGNQYIKIVVKSSIYCNSTASFSMPFFDHNTMYENMKVDKEYTIEELELDKEWKE